MVSYATLFAGSSCCCVASAPDLLLLLMPSTGETPVPPSAHCKRDEVGLLTRYRALRVPRSTPPREARPQTGRWRTRGPGRPRP